ncbi:MAG TPA: DNA polymerase III subunit delta, partial [Chitinophagaceae bacterium]
IGVPSFFFSDYAVAIKLYSYQQVESALLLLHTYNLKSVGVNDAGTEGASLLKEMIVKMIA